MSRNMTRRYAWAGMLFNALKLESAEAVEPEGPGASAARSLPAPASVELKALSRCGPNCSWPPARPSLFSAVAERLAAQRLPASVCDAQLSPYPYA